MFSFMHNVHIFKLNATNSYSVYYKLNSNERKVVAQVVTYMSQLWRKSTFTKILNYRELQLKLCKFRRKSPSVRTNLNNVEIIKTAYNLIKLSNKFKIQYSNLNNVEKRKIV